MSRQSSTVVRAARDFLHAAASQIEGAAFPIAATPWGVEADKDHLLVEGRRVASRMGASVVLAGGDSMYPIEGVDSLVAAIESIARPCTTRFPEVHHV